MSNPTNPAHKQVIQWINEAGVSEGKKKSDLLRKICEVLLHQIPEHIPDYIDNFLSFINNKNTEVKKQVAVFIDEISKLHPEYIPKVIGHLRLLLADDVVVAVQKRAIQAASIVYRNSFKWMCRSYIDPQELQHVWKSLVDLKLTVLNMIDSENEGIRTHSIKFLEEVIMLQSPGDGSEDDFSIKNLPEHLTVINRMALSDESEHIFNLLLKFHNSQHISSVNLMACMSTLCQVGRYRPQFMARVVQALGELHNTLPPTLSQSQVNSVRKYLRMLLLNTIKQASSNEHWPQLTQLLLNLGMTSQEINKALPKERRNKRAMGTITPVEVPAKRFKPDLQGQGGDSAALRSEPLVVFDEDSSPPAPATLDSEEAVLEGLHNVDNVVKLVMATLLHNLPEEIPPAFATLYKPIPNAGTLPHKKALAKMIFSLLKGEPYVPHPPAQSSLAEIAAKIPPIKPPPSKEELEKLSLKNAVAKLAKVDKLTEDAIDKLMEDGRQETIREDDESNKEKEKLIAPPTPSIPKLKQKVRLLKLQEITLPLPREVKMKLMLQAVNRILRAEKDCEMGGASNVRAKLITIFASSYTTEIRGLVLNYILEEPVARVDLALAWLYEEYAIMQGFNRHPITLQPKVNEKHDQNYNQLLCALITQLFERCDPAVDGFKDVLLRRLYYEAPVVTEEAVDFLKHLVSEDKMAAPALEVLEGLILMRPPRAHKIWPALVCHVLSGNAEVQELALKATLRMYRSTTELGRKMVDKQALLQLGFILLPSPPAELRGGPHGGRVPWREDLYHRCTKLVMALLFENDELMLEVGRVYGVAEAEAKRVVLRAVEAPARAAAGGGDLSPALRALLDDCPRGAETLLTRLVHIFTEKTPPSAELVDRVRELYATRVSDVRFLIPVLTGLTKKEILAALPKLIKLNPVVVKEVFNKLLGLNNGEGQSPVSPEELMVQLHLIDPARADIKYIIKGTALCFAEKEIFTQDVLMDVLQKLLEEPEIPVLMMRTVLQALTLYPSLSGFLLNVLQLLAEREVWSNKVAWEGWVKTCERLVPQACPLLLSLPPRALRAAATPAVVAALRQHRASMPPDQVPAHLNDLLKEQPQYQPAPGLVNPDEPLPPGME